MLYKIKFVAGVTERGREMKQYEMFELRFNGKEPEGSYVEVEVMAEFEKDGKKECVKGFYAGKGEYVIRFYPSEVGTYRYRVTGMAEISGEEICEPADEMRHGMVRAEGIHFKYDDGKWYYPFGTTVYALLHQTDELIDQTMETLKMEPFNKIRICVFPKYYDYNHNDPEYYAFEQKDDKWDVHRPCFEFWNRIEERIQQLDNLGIQCDLILFHPYDKWGFATLSQEQALVYLDYVTRRLSAFPNIWWSLANEYDIMSYEKKDWEHFAHFICERDPYGHLLSNHHMIKAWDFSNPDTTHICVQTGKLDNIRADINKYKKPMMVDECGYEGNVPMNWGNLSAFELVNRFWKVCLQGAYCTHGETFENEEELLWWSKGGRLIGRSPQRIAFLKEIVDSMPGPLEDDVHVMSIEEVRELKKNPPAEFAKSGMYQSLLNTDDEQVIALAALGAGFTAHVGTEVYMKYYERQCTCKGTLDLPESGLYDVEIIDVWEMSRTKVMEHVNGHIQISLPGKEGIAILATNKGNK